MTWFLMTPWLWSEWFLMKPWCVCARCARSVSSEDSLVMSVLAMIWVTVVPWGYPGCVSIYCDRSGSWWCLSVSVLLVFCVVHWQRSGCVCRQTLTVAGVPCWWGCECLGIRHIHCMQLKMTIYRLSSLSVGSWLCCRCWLALVKKNGKYLAEELVYGVCAVEGEYGEHLQSRSLRWPCPRELCSTAWQIALHETEGTVIVWDKWLTYSWPNWFTNFDMS